MTHRRFISIILAAAIAITGMTTAPARADADDVAKWIAGAAALAIIGAAIADDRRDDRAVTRYRNYNHNNYDSRRHHGKKRYHNQHRYDSYSLPSRCYRAVQTRRGELRGFGRRCLLNNYSNFNTLPHKCAVKSRDYNGQRRVIYRQNCLARHGYGLAQNGYGVANKGRR